MFGLKLSKGVRCPLMRAYRILTLRSNFFVLFERTIITWCSQDKLLLVFGFSLKYFFFLLRQVSKAGLDTSSSTMSFCLFEIAKNQKVQSLIQEEIDVVTAKYNNQITYESFSEMKYSEACIDGKNNFPTSGIRRTIRS